MRIVTRQSTNKGTPAISYMIQERLRARTLNESTNAALSPHPDEDTMCAFVEARLDSDESLPVISHLIACGVCRRATAELVRLESQFDENDETPMLEESPGPLRLILDSITSSITPSITPPSLEDSVYGYQIPETDEEQDVESVSDLESPKKDEESPQ
jgi:hypothetical protein